MAVHASEAPDIPALLLETWLVYEGHERMVDAAAEAGVSLAVFKRRLHELYTLLGVRSSQQAGRSMRERGII